MRGQPGTTFGTALQPAEAAARAVPACVAVFSARSLTVQEVATALSMSAAQITNLIEEGELLAINIGGKVSTGTADGCRKTWRIPATALEEFIEKRKSV